MLGGETEQTGVLERGHVCILDPCCGAGDKVYSNEQVLVFAAVAQEVVGNNSGIITPPEIARSEFPGMGR